MRLLLPLLLAGGAVAAATAAERSELCPLIRERFGLLLAADDRVALECP